MCDVACSDKPLVINKNECTLDKFKNQIRSLNNKIIYVLFKASWCGACTHFMPIFKSKVDKCKKDNDKVMIIVDNDTGKDIHDAYDISSFPTVKVFFNNQIIKEFSGADSDELNTVMSWKVNADNKIVDSAGKSIIRN